MNADSDQLIDGTDAPLRVSVNLRSIATASFALAVVFGTPVYIASAMKGEKPSGDAEILIGAFILACGFFLAFVGTIWHGITHGSFGRNLGAIGFLLMTSALPVTILLVLAYIIPFHWPVLLSWGLVLAVDLFFRSRKSAA